MNEHPSFHSFALHQGASFVLLAALAAGCGDSSGADGGTSPGDDAGTSGTVAEVIMEGRWAADMALTLNGDTLSISDDGLPDHSVLAMYSVPDGSLVTVSAAPYTVDIPSSPQLAAAPTATGLGTIGVAISGGVLFNPYEGDGSFALEDTFQVDGIPFLDACSGHPLGDGTQYHYHGVPYCITDELDSEGEHSVLIGVLRDGFPVYGPQDIGGAAPTDLDTCNGHFGPTPEFPDGIYHYHTTTTAPYIMECYSGVVDDVTGDMDMGPGGMGGMAMACADGQTSGCCGDGMCDGPETADNCDVDCS